MGGQDSKTDGLTDGVDGNTHTKDDENQENQVGFLIHGDVIASALPSNIDRMDTI
jgi:hypothetical protein